ncbi:hypothetical protein K493DRAFT_314524 [Basidiobolus meristosporus CBS 931.73]|uniref:RlpA-like protein double-psi beta-barrel domain-containing protein n=1 Tax=Basidiobolus meristosporus CBS 931.73 TaxID=1314790 RepID=A0A1Y1YFC8_9FUNG|nr:hypothetical protein K493DRAFT_314524 [Basidiobolus meristosporus CBS 931.73]|eukprot:ORX96406.1 hypothetical protein K493DRAFT_314524 [Basidiobolus meristosporus CBS 931.73]
MFNFKISVASIAIVALSALQMIETAPVNVRSGTSIYKRDGFSGEGTYYDPGLGSCEVTSSPNELIAALNVAQFGSYARPSNSPACSSCALVHGPLGSVQVKIVDMCPGCKHGDLDLSPAAFNRIAKQADGRVQISWEYVSCGGGSQPEKPTKSVAAPKETETQDPAPSTKPKPTKDVKPVVSPTPTNKPVISSIPKSGSGACTFSGRRCTNPGQSAEFEGCLHGRLYKQSCSHGTVCKGDSGDIVCTWA